MNQQRGFTLIEVLIAITIFAIMITIGYSGLSSMTRSQEITEKNIQRLSDLQLGFKLIQNDLEQAIDRPIRDELGDQQGSMRSGIDDSNLIEFVRLGWNNPSEQARSRLQHIYYELNDNQLIRHYYYHVDQTQGVESIQRVLFDQVNAIEINYINNDRESVGNWSSESNTPLPLAIEIIISFDDIGDVRRLFRVAG